MKLETQQIVRLFTPGVFMYVGVWTLTTSFGADGPKAWGDIGLAALALFLGAVYHTLGIRSTMNPLTDSRDWIIEQLRESIPGAASIPSNELWNRYYRAIDREPSLTERSGMVRLRGAITTGYVDLTIVAYIFCSLNFVLFIVASGAQSLGIESLGAWADGQDRATAGAALLIAALVAHRCLLPKSVEDQAEAVGRQIDYLATVAPGLIAGRTRAID